MSEKVSIVSDMLRIFRDGGHYLPVSQDVPLLPETGDPQVSLGNLHVLDLVAQDMIAGRGGVLILFASGEQYLATGFRVGGGPATEKLAKYAAEQHFGDYGRLLWAWSALADDYEGKLPKPIQDAPT
jgi:hypothetical protein